MEFLKKDNILIGIFVGFVFPVMAFGVLLMLFELGTDAGLIDEVADPLGGKRLRTTTIIALCANAFFIHFYNNRYTQQALRGILIITFIGALIWFFVFYTEIMIDF